MKKLSPNAEYVAGFSAFMLLYVAAVLFDGFYFRNHTPLGAPQSPWLYVFAILPSLPIGGTIVVFLRYLDRVDEYLRAIMARRFIIATGITLFVCSAWGFLENYAHVQHFDLYYVYILFWLSFGIVTPFTREVK